MKIGDKFLVLWPPGVNSFASMITFDSYMEQSHQYPFLAKLTHITKSGEKVILRTEYGPMGMKSSALQEDKAFDPITL